jgi:hypothetical protein
MTFNEVVSNWINQRTEPAKRVTVLRVDINSDSSQHSILRDGIEVRIHTITAEGTTGMFKANYSGTVVDLMRYVRDHWPEGSAGASE